MRALAGAASAWLLVFGAAVGGCDNDLHIATIVAQDYRFVPSVARLSSGRPFTLSIRNEGREPHEFTSRLLVYGRAQVRRNGPRPAPHIRVLPGRTAQVTIDAPAGTYLFSCRIRGHRGMNGTIILE